ncbi:MAG TPA: hypothetical protein VKB88_34650 [Bryobacteraceae bacterium]|nr:hypothetical protein [Bryobacteraceae bacterium]
MPRLTLFLVALLLLTPSYRRHTKHPAVISEVLVSDPEAKDLILRGVFPGSENWRWTAPAFAFSLDPPTISKPLFLETDFTVPEALALPVTVTAKVNGTEVARQSYDKSSRTRCSPAPSPPPALATRPATVEFSSDRIYTDPATRRGQGVIVTSAGLMEFEQTTRGREAEMAKSRAAYAQVIKERDLKLSPDEQRELMLVFHDLTIWESL